MGCQIVVIGLHQLVCRASRAEEMMHCVCPRFGSEDAPGFFPPTLPTFRFQLLEIRRQEKEDHLARALLSWA